MRFLRYLYRIYLSVLRILFLQNISLANEEGGYENNVMKNNSGQKVIVYCLIKSQWTSLKPLQCSLCSFSQENKREFLINSTTSIQKEHKTIRAELDVQRKWITLTAFSFQISKFTFHFFYFSLASQVYNWVPLSMKLGVEVSPFA